MKSLKGIISPETPPLHWRPSDLMELHCWGGISLKIHLPRSQLKSTSTLMLSLTPLSLTHQSLLQLKFIFSTVPY